MKLDGFTRKIGNAEQLLKAREIIFCGGKDNGLRAVELDNGLIRCTVLRDRCLDIADLSHRGVNIGFISKNGVVAEPYEFGRVFGGGFLHTCGLDSIGANPGHAQHGNVHFIPAESVFIDKREVSVCGTMRDTALFGQNLALKRKISLKLGSNVLKIEDELVNEGFTAQRYALLYHFNLGYPFIDSGAEIEADISSSEGADEFAAGGLDKALIMEEPVDGGREKVFYHDVKEGNVKIINRALRKSVNFCYDKNMLPFLIEWKSMISGDYALGVEPSTSQLWDRLKYRTVEAGESLKFKIVAAFK